MITDKDLFKKSYQYRFETMFAKTLNAGTNQEKFLVLADIVRDQISLHWLEHQRTMSQLDVKEVYYFSIEYLPGRFLISHLIYLNMLEVVEHSLKELGIDLQELADQEEDPGLGNGGLGRLASGLLDSLAALDLPGHGMGIRYKHGLFEQKIIEGQQVELPDNWLYQDFPWEYRRVEEAVHVKFGGQVRSSLLDGKTVFIQEGFQEIKAVPYDIPIPGFRNRTVNVLRLWQAEPVRPDYHNAAYSPFEYQRIIRDQASAQVISQVLYPDDSAWEGKRLRLMQEYFFVSAGLQSIVRKYKSRYHKMDHFAERIALHINDTHPSLVIPELMRILLDDEGMSWEEAWEITLDSVSYTNHTILPEALERWPLDLFRELLPRIAMLVEEINRRFCVEIEQKYPGDRDMVRTLSIIGDNQVRMGNLSIVGSRSVNGVSAIHTEILQQRAMQPFYRCFPQKFNNKTNGVTQRRWFLVANPALANLLTEALGEKWIMDPRQLESLAPLADDPVFRARLDDVKKGNKFRLASFIFKKYGISINPDSIFDVQIKRMHAYKRQLLNALHIMSLYNILRNDKDFRMLPRTFIFGGKAAPAYHLAKKVIRLISALGDIVNNDPVVRDRIKVVFLENYNVSLAELIIPATEVSEQLSTASREASGTGNMKFMMNGAITIGTLDGANIEIRNAVGEDNFFTFGLTAEKVLDFNQFGGYSAWNIYNKDPRLKEVCDQLINGFFPDREEFRVIYDYLLQQNDEYFVLQDFSSYAETQRRVEEKYWDRNLWLRMSALNIAHSGIFSSDRCVREYAEEIWKIKPLYKGV